MIRKKPRQGVTVLDAAIGFGCLTAALVLATQTAVWVVGERRQLETRQQAVELLDGVLESARAVPWDELSSKWAEEERRRVLEALAGRLEAPQLALQIQPEPGRAGTRRVTADLTWKQAEGWPVAPLTVTALFTRRTQAGGQP